MAIIVKDDTLKWHKQAMYYAQDAVVAKSDGKELEARYYFELALNLELEVFDKLRNENTNPDTLGIIMRSAASLAINCRRFKKATEIINHKDQFQFSDHINNELNNLLTDIEIQNGDERAQQFSGDILLIEPFAPMRELLMETLQGMANIQVFDDIRSVPEFLEKNTLPAMIIMGVKNASADNPECNLLLKLMNDYGLENKIYIILLAAKKPQYDELWSAFGSSITDVFTLPFHPVDLQEVVNRKLMKAGGEFSQKTYHLYDHSQVKVPKHGGAVLKRVFDIVFSLLLIIFLLPIFILVALAIKLESRGPVFYNAKRAGQNFRIFKFYKFRTMAVDKDFKGHWNAQSSSDPVFYKISNDPRLTKVGKFLRNTSLDELPQLFNVLLGDMSLVGNRPLPLYEAATLSDYTSVERYQAAAGMFGLGQLVKTWKSDLSLDEMVKLDLRYNRKSNFQVDLWIFIKSIGVNLRRFLLKVFKGDRK